MAKVLELQFLQQSFQWVFRVDVLLDQLVWSPCSPRDSQESSPASQFKSITSSVLSLLYDPILTSTPEYWRNRSFIQTFVSKMVSLLFSMLSRFVIAFRPRNKASWDALFRLFVKPINCFVPQLKSLQWDLWREYGLWWWGSRNRRVEGCGMEVLWSQSCPGCGRVEWYVKKEMRRGPARETWSSQNHRILSFWGEIP